MANKTLESTVLSIEVKSGTDKDGNLVSNAAPDKVQAVALLVANLLEKDTGYFYVTEVSQIEE